MMKHKYWFLVVGILMSLFLLPAALAPEYEDTEEDWGYTMQYKEDYDEDEDWIYGGSLGGEDEGDEDYDSETSPGFSLFFGMKLHCYVKERDPEDKNRFVVYEGTTKYGHLFTEDYGHDDLAPFLPYDKDLSTIRETYFIETNGIYSWTDSEPITLFITSENSYENAKLHRFEGLTEDNTNFENHGCIPFIGLVNTVNFTASWPLAFDAEGKEIDTEFYSEEGQPPVVAYDVPSVGVDINWDSTPEDCEAINGSWYGESGYSGYRCCGDDRMWLSNRAVNSEDGFEKPLLDDDDIDALDPDEGTKTMSSFCLYGTGDLEDSESNEIGYENLQTDGRYSCSSTDFEAYDDSLDLDNDYETEENVQQDTPYLFQNSDDAETDLGKWSDIRGQNPQFCFYERSETEGEQYNWLDINTAGDLLVDIEGNEITDFREDHAKTICEAYLGGVKTGAYCCGNKYDYNAEFLDEAGYYNESFSDETPIYWYPDKPEEGSFANYACVDGAAIDTKQTAWKKGTDEQSYELLNVGGNLSSCAVENPSILGDDYYKKSPLVEDDSDYNVTACDVVEGQLCFYNPDAEDNQYPWQWEDRTTSSYVTNTLLYSEGDSFTLSTAKWAGTEGYEQESACCAGNACWDGDACVPAPTFYHYGEDEDNNGLGDDVAICSAGEWQYPTEPKYDWYHNTDAEAVTYCAYPYACVCSSNEDDETFCTENDAYLEAGCTLVEGFYKGDHYCEALDADSDGSYDSSQWTSRTKFLAFQLLDIAETEETGFTIFCDKYADAINNYATLEPVEEDINSVCVLEQEGKVIFGISLNSEDDESMAVDANELLFYSGSKSIVPNILEEDAVNNCDDAIAHIPDPTSRFGEFYSCDSSTTTWYNNNLSVLIYSKDGLDYKTTIDYPNIDDRQNDFDAYKETIITHITDASDDGTLVNPDGTPLSIYFAEFNTTQDYNSLYYNYNADSGNTIFGFQEIKYSENAADNRYYTAVLYNGYALDCDQVYAPYDTALPVYCNSEGIVLERSTSGSEYWNDLTAAIRVE